MGDSDGTTNHRTATYTYDTDGNRATKALGGGTVSHAHVYTGRNQIQAVTIGVGGAILTLDPCEGN